VDLLASLHCADSGLTATIATSMEGGVMALTVSFISFARSWSLARRLFALQAAVVLIVLSGASLAAYLQFSRANTDAAAREMLGVAHTLAADPAVLAALATPDPSTALQPLAEEVRVRTGTDFVVVMSTDGIRYSHPTVGEIGRHYLGSISEAARGESYTETYVGTLGPSVRAVVPVWRGSQIVALVSVGRTVSAVSAALAAEIPLIVAGGVSALLLAAVGAWLVSRWLRRSTRDLPPVELRRRNTYYDAVLHAVREGLLLLDGHGRIELVNDEARRLLRLDEDVVGRQIDAVGLPLALGTALAGRSVGPDEIHLTEDRIVVVNQGPARDFGTVVTLRDHTELRALVSELQTVRGFADSLNAQAHEAANHLHTVVALIELGRPEEAVEYASGELEIAQQLTDLVLGAFAVPELAAFVVGKAAQAAERDVELVVEPATTVPAGVADPRDLITIVGNLVDNAVDAALDGLLSDSAQQARVRLGGAVESDELVLRVGDSGPGLAPDVAARAFERGVSTKPAEGLGRGLGLALVQQAVHRNGGRVEVGTGPDGGAEFTVRLPLPVPAERAWTVAQVHVP
jgi:two-component system, CitB family, sensor kinase